MLSCAQFAQFRLSGSDSEASVSALGVTGVHVGVGGPGASELALQVLVVDGFEFEPKGLKSQINGRIARVHPRKHVSRLVRSIRIFLDRYVIRPPLVSSTTVRPQCTECRHNVGHSDIKWTALLTRTYMYTDPAFSDSVRDQDELPKVLTIFKVSKQVNRCNEVFFTSDSASGSYILGDA
ncbi:hypothetical protein PoB_005923300 [Plakobranchus ocellatus]|uniref:Uncharacterized protein n=1 Tax=Plakobranchus ocellatus TaxID=259542 RepID=A0AAV4CMV8_9GAST|nr:hypothetical protein PoB_005923300 [Plakobranchus ocellatus]